MDVIFGLAATFLGIFVFIYAFSLIVVSTRLVKLQLWEGLATPAVREAAGEDLPYLDAGRAVLEGEGFVYLRTWQVRSLIASSSVPAQYIDVYHHSLHDVRAEVSAAPFPTPQKPFAVSLWNSYTDGTALLTVDGLAHTLITFPRKVAIADAYAADFSAQLAHHLEQRASCAAPRTDAADLPAYFAALSQSMLPVMVGEGKAYPRGKLDGYPVYGIRLRKAIKTAWRMQRGARKLRQMAKLASQKGAAAEAEPAARHAAERRAFVQNLSLLNSLRAPRWFRWSSLLVSAAAFVAVGAWLWGIAAALVMVAVIAFHEAGHWLAMRLAGFRDVHVFFVPGMGAATSGEKNDASPLTHLAVFLAGPVPGLLLALGAFTWMMLGQADDGAWWHATLNTVIFSAFVLNMLNLLPLMPLDGGRVIDLFVMGRFPWIRFIFALISGAALLWMGLQSDDKVLSGLGIIMLMALPHHFRMAKLSRDLLHQPGMAPLASETFSEAAGRLHAFLSRPAYKQWRFEVKVGVAQNILPRFLGRLPSARETLLGLCMYVACIALPIALVVAFAARAPTRFVQVVPLAGQVMTSFTGGAHLKAHAVSQRNDARLAATAGPVLRIALLGKLMEQANDDFDIEEQLRLARMLYAETAAPDYALQHVTAAANIATAARVAAGPGWIAESSRMSREAEATLRQRLARNDSGDEAMLLARVLAERDAPSSSKAAIEHQTDIVKLHADHWQTSGFRLPSARTGLAVLLDDAGRKADAEQQLLIAEEDAKRLPNSVANEYQVQELALNHAWFLVASQRPQDALKRLAVYLAKPVVVSPELYTIERNTYELAAIAARSQGDWQQVKKWTTLLHKFKQDESASWMEKTFSSAQPAPRYDLGVGLLLVEAERHLGHGPAADKLVAEMRAQFSATKGGKNICHLSDSYYDSWRKPLQDAVRDNEKREFKCEEPAPPLKCKVPEELPVD